MSYFHEYVFTSHLMGSFYYIITLAFVSEISWECLTNEWDWPQTYMVLGSLITRRHI